MDDGGGSAPAGVSRPGRLPPPRMVISNTVVEESKLADATAVPIGPNNGWYSGVQDDEDDIFFKRRKRNVFPRLLNWWASWISIIVSAALLGEAICSFRAHRATLPSSALIFLLLVAFTLCPLSLVVGFCNAALPHCAPGALQLTVAQHAALQFLICLSAVLPLSQGLWRLGCLTLLHFVPAALFYVARARREPTPAKALVY